MPITARSRCCTASISRSMSGGITTLLGANGAGKTTTLRSLTGMTDTKGEIRFDGRSIAGRATEDIVRLGIAHVPQGRGTFVRETVEENLQIGAMTRRGGAEIAADMERVYGYFPRLKERRRQQAGTLSGGEQQMLAVGRAYDAAAQAHAARRALLRARAAARAGAVRHPAHAQSRRGREHADRRAERGARARSGRPRLSHRDRASW